MLYLATSIFAVSQDELAQAKQLIDSNASCASLSDEQFELIGEYFMEQMHPGEAHDFMHRMMGLQEGTQEEKQFHVNLAKSMYCGEGTSSGMTGSGVRGGMMQTMMGSGTNGGWGGMMGYGWSGTEGITGLVFWLLVFAALILFVIWLYRSLSIKGTAGEAQDAMAVLKARFVKGEITKKEFEEIKKEIEK